MSSSNLEKTLRQTEEGFSLFIEGVKDYAIFTLDPQGHVAVWNAGAERIKGYKAEEIIGRHFSLFYTAEDMAKGKPQQTLETARDKGGAEGEGWQVRKDGSRFWAKVLITPLYDETGQLRGFSKVTRDTTQRALEERLRSVVDHVVDGIITIDERGQIEAFNPAAEGLFGYKESEVIGRNVNVLMPAPYRSEHDGYLSNYLRTGEAKIIGVGREVVGRRKDGSTFPMDLAVSTFCLHERRFFTGIVRDITERQRVEKALRHEIEQRRGAEAALREAHAELEQKVQDRTAELGQVNARLQKSLHEKDVLLREIHHRVKNNLQIVSTLLDLQSDHTKDEQTLEMFKQSQGRVKSMALIHERLYRSQDLARVDFGQYVRQLADDLYHTYKVSSEEIVLHVQVDVPPLPIDIAIPCGLLINELMSNCLKHAFANASDGWIKVALCSTDSGNVLSVADNGGGFPRDLDFRNTPSFGLQLVNTLAKQLEGKIELNTEVGTDFTVRFPKKAALTGTYP